MKFDYAKNVKFGREIFTLSPVAYKTVYFKRLVSDLFQKPLENSDVQIQIFKNYTLLIYAYPVIIIISCIITTKYWLYVQYSRKTSLRYFVLLHDQLIQTGSQEI